LYLYVHLPLMFYTYILQSEIDNSYYIGHSSDIMQRLEYHNHGLSKFTSKKIPWKQVYLETFQTKKEANMRELFLKRQRNRSFYERLIPANQIKFIKSINKNIGLSRRGLRVSRVLGIRTAKKLQETGAFFVFIGFSFSEFKGYLTLFLKYGVLKRN